LLRRMRTRDDHEEFTSFINPNYSWDTYLIDLLLDDNGALAMAALEYLEGKGNVFEEEEEPRSRRHRTQGEFDDWPSNAQMEYFKRGGR
jgi:hypothetical protein